MKRRKRRMNFPEGGVFAELVSGRILLLNQEPLALVFIGLQLVLDVKKASNSGLTMVLKPFLFA